MANLQSLQANTNYREAFSLFDKRGEGCVPLDCLGDLLRACGQNPTLAEIRELEKGLESKGELKGKDKRSCKQRFHPQIATAS